jgi:hypothetical protein
MKYRELLEACWKGYHKEGMKTMFGKRYPNCVKNKKTNEEQLDEKCWDGYTQQGMKKKGDRMVPNCVQMSESDLEEDLKKWFKEKWVRFGPDGKVRGECGGRDDSEGKPKCLPASKAHSLGKKGRASSAAKKRREDPNPERRGAAKNVATKTRGMKEQTQLPDQPQPNTLRDYVNTFGKVLQAVRNPEAFADQEIKNYLEPSRQNQSIIKQWERQQQTKEVNK